MSDDFQVAMPRSLFALVQLSQCVFDPLVFGHLVLGNVNKCGIEKGLDCWAVS